MKFKTVPSFKNFIIFIILFIFIYLSVAGCSQISKTDKYIQNLKSENKEARKEAANSLAWITDSKAVEPLIGALKDVDEEVRIEAAFALGKIGDIRAVEPLIEALIDEPVKQSAANALGDIGDIQAINPLIEALKDKDSYVQSAAETALRKICDKNDSQSIEPLILALHDKDKYVQTTCADILVSIGQPSLDTIVVALKSDESIRYIITRILIRIGNSSAEEALIDTLKENGTKELAELFLNSGNGQLQDAASSWAKDNGYDTTVWPGVGGISWGDN